MTDSESLIAGRLLIMAAARFHEDSCTDTPHELFKGISVKSREQMSAAFNSWNLSEDSESSTERVDFQEIQIDEWMRFVAYQLGYDEEQDRGVSA